MLRYFCAILLLLFCLPKQADAMFYKSNPVGRPRIGIPKYGNLYVGVGIGVPIYGTIIDTDTLAMPSGMQKKLYNEKSYPLGYNPSFEATLGYQQVLLPLRHEITFAFRTYDLSTNYNASAPFFYSDNGTGYVYAKPKSSVLQFDLFYNLLWQFRISRSINLGIFFGGGPGLIMSFVTVKDSGSMSAQAINSLVTSGYLYGASSYKQGGKEESGALIAPGLNGLVGMTYNFTSDIALQIKAKYTFMGPSFGSSGSTPAGHMLQLGVGLLFNIL